MIYEDEDSMLDLPQPTFNKRLAYLRKQGYKNVWSTYEARILRKEGFLVGTHNWAVREYGIDIYKLDVNKYEVMQIGVGVGILSNLQEAMDKVSEYEVFEEPSRAWSRHDG